MLHGSHAICNIFYGHMTYYKFFLYIFFGGLECVSHSFAYVAHL
jgi:hypothetical protein